MSAWPEADAIRAFLGRVARRARLLAMAQGAGIGLVVALMIGHPAMRPPGLMAVVIAVAGLFIGAALGALRVDAPAKLVEQRAPQSRNIVWTAAELIDTPGRVSPHVVARVCSDAARIVRTLDPRKLFPARRALLALGAAAVAWTLLLGATRFMPSVIPGAESRDIGTTGAPVLERVRAVITPPAYIGGTAQTLSDPDRIEALAGSTIRLEVQTNASAVAIETVSTRDTLYHDGNAFTGSLTLDADGYLALEARSTEGRTARRLIGLKAVPDYAPIVRITTPGRDLVVPDGNRRIDVVVEASDDHALAALELTYTHVTGSGEQHSFTQGAVALTLTREGEASWRGRGTLRLDTLNLQPGEMVVYRAIARDRRPGAPVEESDAFIVERSAPGDVAMEGFSSDEEDRYALSQQMVLVKTERLIARAGSLPEDSVREQAMLIAAEQRSVRAEFVFMMGGELESDVLTEASMDELNEEAHVELDDEAIAGRLRNRGRADLLAAIRAMSRANTALLATDLEAARTEERTAIDLLQRAFSRTRYILRALTQRERLDLERRLTGDLAGVGRTGWPAPTPAETPRLNALRSVLADIASLTARTDAEAASAAAMAVLRIGPAAEPLRAIAADLDAAAAAMSNGRTQDADALLNRAALALAAHVRAETGRGVAAPPSLRSSRVRGALTDALREAQ